jgi:O-antigen/teichoic acid export membrane protein
MRKQWQGDSPYDMLDRNLKRMGLTMLIGAILDVILAIAVFLFPLRFMALTGMGAPQDMFYLQLLPLLHLVLPAFCIVVWMDPKRNVAGATAAIIARLVYAVFMFVSVWIRGLGWVWAAVGATSLALAVSHYVFLRRSDFGFWEVFSRAGNPPGAQKR